MLPILRAQLTCCRCHKSIELHEKRHRAIGVLRDSLLQLVEKGAEGTYFVAGVSGNGKPCQHEISALLMMKAERTGKKSTEDDQTTKTISVDQKDSESLSPRLVITSGNTADNEAESIARTPTLSRHLSRITRGAENEGTCVDLHPLKNSRPGKNSTSLSIGRLNGEEHTESKPPKIQNHLLTAEEHERIHEALHPTPNSLLERATTSRGSTSLAKNEIIDANIAFSSATCNYTSLQEAAHKKKMSCNNGIDKSSRTTVDDSQITAILQRLGICNDMSLDRSRKCQSLLGRLRHAIYFGLVCVENEEREIMMRMAGYWRYVNRRTYNAMVRHSQLWDWATSAKLEELESSDHDAEDDDEGAQETAFQEITAYRRSRRDVTMIRITIHW